MHVIATAGHVDHGKSTLIRQLTGMEPDRWEEERRRGLTIDLGFAWARLDDGCGLAFVDVPGHERFVANMLAGVGPAPAVMFVVAADEGWKAQSAEHLAALDALGVQHGVLVISRSDLADPRAAEDQAREQLSGTSLDGIPSVAVSGKTGDGLPQLRRELDALAHRLPAADPTADIRLWADRVFTIRGAGTVVTGTLTAGTLRPGQRLQVSPGGKEVTIRGLQSLGTPREEVRAVARVAVNLRNADPGELRRGHALLTPDRWITTDVLDARLSAAKAGELPTKLMLHIGAASVDARIRPLGSDAVRLALRTPLPLRIGDRALLRDPGSHRIFGGLLVLDVDPPPLKRRGAARARAAELANMGETPDPAAEARRRGLVRTDRLRAMGATPPADAGRWLFDADHRAELAAQLIDLVRRYRREHPLQPAMPVEAARQALGLPEASLVAEVAATAGIPLQSGKLGDARPQLPERVARAVRAITRQLAEEPFQAPTAEELRALGVAERELAAAERAGALLRIAPGLVLLPDAEQRAVERLAQLPAPFTLSQARKALRTTRRVAVPLLEHLARRGRTERLDDGTHRVVSAAGQAGSLMTNGAPAQGRR